MLEIMRGMKDVHEYVGDILFAGQLGARYLAHLRALFDRLKKERNGQLLDSCAGKAQIHIFARSLGLTYSSIAR